MVTIVSESSSPNCIMKTKELIWRSGLIPLRCLKQGLVIKTISQALIISQRFVQSYFWKMKEEWMNRKLPKTGLSTKLTDGKRRALIREAQEVQSIPKTVISCALHKSDLYRRVARRKPLLGKKIKSGLFVICHKSCGDPADMWKKQLYTDVNKMKNGLV